MVYLYSPIKITHGPINLRSLVVFTIKSARRYNSLYRQCTYGCMYSLLLMMLVFWSGVWYVLLWYQLCNFFGYIKNNKNARYKYQNKHTVFKKDRYVISTVKPIRCINISVWHMSVAVCTFFNSWWWTERPSETCRVLLQQSRFETLMHPFGFTIEIVKITFIQRYYL